jgi:cold shock CspA family protein
MEADEIKTGQVVFYNSAKGWGFVKESVSLKEYFVHHSEVRTKGIGIDDRVNFRLGLHRDKIVAVEVSKI